MDKSVQLAENQLSELKIDTITINPKHFIPLVVTSVIPNCSTIYSDIRSEPMTKYLSNKLKSAAGFISVQIWRDIVCSPYVLHRLRTTAHLKKEDFGCLCTIFPTYETEKLSIIYLIAFSSFTPKDRTLVYEDENVVALRTKVKLIDRDLGTAKVNRELVKKIFIAMSE